MSNTDFRWGIIGLGSIAGQFANGLKSSPGAKLYAVGSRAQDKADEFAARFKAEKAYATYEEVAADPNVDAVYIATPHTKHAPNAKICIEHGKPALVKKPFTVNAGEAREVIDLAREKDVFCMEAMWTRYFPIIERLREVLACEEIGKPRILQADFGFRAGWNPKSRLLNPNLAGGGLLDVGVYAISLASMIFGTPDKVSGYAQVGETGVDEYAAYALHYAKNNAIAHLASGVRLNMAQAAYLYGDLGSVHLPSPWWRPSTMVLKREGRDDETINLPPLGNGYNYQADEVKVRVRAGALESPIMRLDETLSIMETMDALRREWGVVYPSER